MSIHGLWCGTNALGAEKKKASDLRWLLVWLPDLGSNQGHTD